MRRFKVIVDGREHDVQMVEVTEPDACPPETRGQALEPNCAATVERHGGAAFSGQSGSAAGSAAAGSTGVPGPARGQEDKVSPEGLRKVEAPLAGTILSVRVKEGDRVKVGDVLVTLEALKLENEIASPYCGVVRSVNVKAGESVQAGAILVTVEELAS